MLSGRSNQVLQGLFRFENRFDNHLMLTNNPILN
jgi:hypothetical protein